MGKSDFEGAEQNIYGSMDCLIGKSTWCRVLDGLVFANI